MPLLELPSGVPHTRELLQGHAAPGGPIDGFPIPTTWLNFSEEENESGRLGG